MIGINTKVNALLEAITEHEGWKTPNETTHGRGSRSYRNHNPGNLRKSPFQSDTVDGFAVFRNDFIGYMALHWDLLQKARGQTTTGLNAKSTIRELLAVYAPASDNNDPDAYARYVATKMGVTVDTTLGEVFEITE